MSPGPIGKSSTTPSCFRFCQRSASLSMSLLSRDEEASAVGSPRAVSIFADVLSKGWVGLTEEQPFTRRNPARIQEKVKFIIYFSVSLIDIAPSVVYLTLLYF